MIRRRHEVQLIVVLDILLSTCFGGVPVEVAGGLGFLLVAIIDIVLPCGVGKDSRLPYASGTRLGQRLLKRSRRPG